MDEQIAFRYRKQQLQSHGKPQEPQGGGVRLTDTAGRPLKRRPPPAADDEIGEEDSYYGRSHTSIRRYDVPDLATQQGSTRYELHPNQVIPRRRSAQPKPPDQHSTEAIPAAKAQRRIHWFVYVGVGMMVALTLWIAAANVLSWFDTWQDDLHYGMPRTAQYTVVVRHGDDEAHPTHFIAINLNAQIVIIEIPGGNTSKTVIYQGPTLYGQDANLAPITLSFEDVNHDGKFDMLVHFQGSEIIYLNENGKFVPQQ